MLYKKLVKFFLLNKMGAFITKIIGLRENVNENYNLIELQVFDNCLILDDDKQKDKSLASVKRTL